MRRLVVDTNVYVDWLNLGLHEELLFQRDGVKYLSAVVASWSFAPERSHHAIGAP
jgi:hypothetical protein